MKKHIIPIILFCIIALAAVTRLYKIQVNPPALSWDEVSIGYNAYSILKTGRDEHGTLLPIGSFVAYGDYKPPLAIYVTVPFVAVFGLNELAVRLPSAICGTLTVLFTYFLVKELFGRSKRKTWTQDVLPFVVTALLAISPWHINLSRAGFEANIGLCLVILGIWLILRSREHPKSWITAWIPFALGIYTFNSTRYFVCLFTLGLLPFCFSYIKKNIRLFVIGVIVAAIVVFPIIPHLLSKDALLRYDEVNIFSDISVVETSNARIAAEGNTLLAKIVNNRRIGYARSYLMHFADHFQPTYLFITGDGNPKFSIQDVGQLYWIDAVFLGIGILALSIDYPGVAALLIFWIITAIIPAAVARETPHALRTLNSLPTWQIFVAYGLLTSIDYIVRNVKNHKNIWLGLLSLILFFIYSFNFAYYLYNYYNHYPKEFSGEWQYGYREAIQFAKTEGSSYAHVVITDSIGRPYMYTLFYTAYDPKTYQGNKQSYFDAAGFYHVTAFDRFVFPGYIQGPYEKNTLYIVSPDGVPEDARVLKTINLLNGKSVLKIFVMD